METDSSICRICLNVVKDCIGFQQPFKCNDYCSEGKTNEMNYLQCLRLCTNLPIEEDDGGPQCLCLDCEAELQIVHHFLKKIKQSQNCLEESWWINDSNNEQIEISIETFDTISQTEDNDCTDSGADNNVAARYNTEFTESYTKNPDCLEYTNNENSLPHNASDEDNSQVKAEKIAEYEEDESWYEIEYLLEDNNTTQGNNRTFIPKKHKCHICNRSYTSENHLKIHLYYHKRRSSKSPAYVCKICGQSFILQRLLTQHMIEHQDCRETYKCQVCDKEYVSKTALISHKRIHQTEALTCNECGKQFNGSYEFTVHQRFHKREKEKGGIKCHICNKEFSSSRYLPQHMAVHFGDREKLSCCYCHKQYRSKTALNNHKRLHEGQTIQCSICEKQFTRNCELEIHMRFHNREHPFKCTICQKGFAIKGHLKTHMWQHEGIKVKCNECGKLFGSTKALNEHSYTHSEMPFPCEFCDKAYPSRQKYKLHLEKVHASGKNKTGSTQIENFQHYYNVNDVQINKEEKTNL